MSSERIADQGETADLEPPRPIRSVEQVLFDHDMRNALDTRFHAKNGLRPGDDDPQMTQMCAAKTSSICVLSASSGDKSFHDTRPKDCALGYLRLRSND